MVGIFRGDWRIKMKWYVYILKCGDDSYYTGITNNVERRLAAHKNGTGAKYTKGRGPFTLMYQELCKDKSEATKREREIKNMRKRDKLALFEE